jgi:hypothetical protein
MKLATGQARNPRDRQAWRSDVGVEIPSGGCGVCGRIRGLGVSMYRRDDRSGGRVDQTITHYLRIFSGLRVSERPSTRCRTSNMGGIGPL